MFLYELDRPSNDRESVPSSGCNHDSVFFRRLIAESVLRSEACQTFQLKIHKSRMNSTIESSSQDAEMWSPTSGGWATWIVLSLMLGLCGVRFAARVLLKKYECKVSPSNQLSRTRSSNGQDGIPAVTDNDLQRLLLLLNDTGHSNQDPWVTVVSKQSLSLMYHAKIRDPKEGGPPEYLSTSVFENCCTEKLRDFYMDNEYRMAWDRSFASHLQLEVCKESGIEIGRLVRKFPLMRPREYVLAWKLWEGEDKTFYYFAKHCRHPQAPRIAMYTRVEHYMSGWRIRKVPGKDACEIKMWHQETAGLMEKVAFSHGIWKYMCDMDRSFRKYKGHQHKGKVDAVELAQKVPPGLMEYTKLLESTESVADAQVLQSNSRSKSIIAHKKQRTLMSRTGKLMANCMLVLGGAVFCTRSAPMGAKIAAAYAIKRLLKPHSSLRK